MCSIQQMCTMATLYLSVLSFKAEDEVGVGGVATLYLSVLSFKAEDEVGVGGWRIFIGLARTLIDGEF